MAPVSGQEAGSNLGPVSQASEGQGSAIQPQRSQQEEESALSAAEEGTQGYEQAGRVLPGCTRGLSRRVGSELALAVAGPAQGRGYLRRPATAKALLRPTASLVSTAQVQQRQSSPPQPQSPKTHSVVSQSIPALQVAPTPGSVHGQQLGWVSKKCSAQRLDRRRSVQPRWSGSTEAVRAVCRARWSSPPRMALPARASVLQATR